MTVADHEPTTVSVIVPTHDRVQTLSRILDALSAQSYPLHRVEVLIVADGCTDGTAEMVRRYDAPFSLRLLEQLPMGPAAARNRGGRTATGELLVFVDDDIEMSPGFLRAHVRACRGGGADTVAVGYLPPVLDTQSEIDRIDLLNHWEAVFDVMRWPGHRFRYCDLLSGNFSLPARLFNRVGGFDPALRCHEDYELGIRLIKAGATFTFSAEAWGFHHQRTDFAGSLRRKFDEGVADVMIARRHPEVRSALPLARLVAAVSGHWRVLRWLAFSRPAHGDALMRSVGHLSELAGRARMRGHAQRLRLALLGYWYLRGAAQELRGRETLADAILRNPEQARYVKRVGLSQALNLYFPHGTSGDFAAEHEPVVDLREGLGAVEHQLDTLRPTAVRIRHGGSFIGRIPHRPGAERIRGAHLRPVLATVLFESLYDALDAHDELEAGREALCSQAQQAVDLNTPDLAS